MAVEVLGHLLAVHVTPVEEQEPAQVRSLAYEVQDVTAKRLS